MVFFINDNKFSYLKKLVGKVYKLLPIYEGKDFYGKIVCSPDEALYNFKKQLILLETEIIGLNLQDDKVEELLILIQGMKRYEVGQHTEVKYCTMKALNICKKIIAYYEDKQ